MLLVYADFPSSATSGNSGFRRNHYRNHYTIRRFGFFAGLAGSPT